MSDLNWLPQEVKENYSKDSQVAFAKAVRSNIQAGKSKALSYALGYVEAEKSNSCHDDKGQFCETGGGSRSGGGALLTGLTDEFGQKAMAASVDANRATARAKNRNTAAEHRKAVLAHYKAGTAHYNARMAAANQNNGTAQTYHTHRSRSHFRQADVHSAIASRLPRRDSASWH